MISDIAIRLAQSAIPAGLLGLIALGSCVPPPAGGDRMAQTPPIPPDQARIWFMRELEPGTATHAPTVYADGAAIGYSPQSTMFYRDVAPGTHVFDVENCLKLPESTRTLNFTAGDEVSLQVTSLQNYAGWDCSPSDTYYLSPVPAQVRPWYFARLTNLGAR